MKIIVPILLLLAFGIPAKAPAQSLPSKTEIIDQLKLVNDYWINGHADPGNNQWARAVYFEGLTAAGAAYPEPRYAKYALDWAGNNAWLLNDHFNVLPLPTRWADDQAAGQVYLDLYKLNPDPARIAEISRSIAGMVAGTAADDWWWVDALQMAMPNFARLGVLNNNPLYFGRMHDYYADTKTRRGLYNTTDHLWYRDGNYVPPYHEPNGGPCYWSRGNGWVLAALARVLESLPPTDAHYAEYLQDFRDMAAALAAVQRGDGFWNSSLRDPGHFGGPECSGTAFFTYGMAWGINRGLLDSATYTPVVARAWNGMAATAVRADGLLGYVQYIGKAPDTCTSVSTADFGVGGWLMAASEVVRLGSGPMPAPRPNLLAGAAVTASAQQPGNEAAKIADGDSLTRWSANGFPNWVEFDLGTVRNIDTAELVSYQNRPYQYRIETRAAASENYRTLVDASTNTAARSIFISRFAASPARYVRLTLTGLADNSTTWASVNEFLVYEAETKNTIPAARWGGYK